MTRKICEAFKFFSSWSLVRSQINCTNASTITPVEATSREAASDVRLGPRVGARYNLVTWLPALVGRFGAEIRARPIRSRAPFTGFAPFTSSFERRMPTLFVRRPLFQQRAGIARVTQKLLAPNESTCLRAALNSKARSACGGFFFVRCAGRNTNELRMSKSRARTFARDPQLATRAGLDSGNWQKIKCKMRIPINHSALVSA